MARERIGSAHLTRRAICQPSAHNLLLGGSDDSSFGMENIWYCHGSFCCTYSCNLARPRIARSSLELRRLGGSKPPQLGEVRNPRGENQYTGRERPFTDAIRVLAHEPLPEHLRTMLNVRVRRELFATLKSVKTARKPEDIPDFYKAGITWAEANAVRQSLSAIFDGNISAAVEIREAVEGRSTTRVEFASQNDKLEQLLEAFRHAA